MNLRSFLHGRMRLTGGIEKGLWMPFKIEKYLNKCYFTMVIAINGG